MNQQEQTARIAGMLKETRKFTAEQHKLLDKRRASVAMEDRTLWMYPVGGMLAGAVLFGAGMIFAKLVG